VERVVTKFLIFSFILAGSAAAQNFDSSNNAALHGDYFIREILIGGENLNGSITSAMSAIGVVTFDGAGNYTYKGSGTGNAIKGEVLATGSTGTYAVGANGLLYIQSLIDTTQYAYGGVSAIGPSAFVASATEGSSADILVAIPAGTTATAASLMGTYSAGYLNFPSSDVTMVKEATFNLSADGQGNLSNVTVSGSAQNLGGGVLNQTVSGATYTLSGEGVGSFSFGSASSAQLLSGPQNFYLSADGNLFIGGTPGGYDLIVGMRSMTGAASNATFSGEYLTAALEDTVTNGSSSIDAFYGSWNANGQGVSIAHDRYQGLLPQQQVFDYTFDSQAPVQSNATIAPFDVPYQFTLGVNGQAFIATGTSGVYSLLVGFGAPKYVPSGAVWLNPLGVVNAASFAPITNPIAPNEVLTLYGSGLAPSSMNAPGLPLPTSLGGVTVTINGEAAPLYYVTPGQIAVLVPQDITPDNSIYNATIQVMNNGVSSNSVSVYTNYTAPGVFSAGGNGIGPAAAQLSNYSLITSSNPVSPGSTAILYASGLGTVNTSLANGAAAPSNPPATATDTDYVYVAGTQENIQFDGLTPGLAGLYQLNTMILSGTQPGTGFADVATPDAYTSEATLAVGGTASAMARLNKLQSLKRAGVRNSRQSLSPLRRVGR
jgi:uncharacterized protein (TIGR03437 family)